MLRKTLVAGAVVAGFMFLLGAGARAEEAAPPAPVYADKGADTCLFCHDTAPVTDILRTPHAVKGDSHTPFGEHGCESCHGASPQHISSAQSIMEGQKPTLPTVRFVGKNASPAEDRNKVCLGCHENGLRMDWHGSKHEDANLACNSCHTIHATKDPVLVKKTQPEKCFTCHATQRADSYKFSHHPIREGKVACADCHNPHGGVGDTKSLKEVTVNETCYNCHAEKRGPLLWEHEPVREDCTNCHTPHGATNVRLLKQRPPFLCISCHANSDTHHGQLFGGQNLPGVSPMTNTTAPGNGVAYTPGGFAADQIRFQAKGCTNCHSQIHGSNSPGGQFFNR